MALQKVAAGLHDKVAAIINKMVWKIHLDFLDMAIIIKVVLLQRWLLSEIVLYINIMMHKNITHIS